MKSRARKISRIWSWRIKNFIPHSSNKKLLDEWYIVWTFLDFPCKNNQRSNASHQHLVHHKLRAHYVFKSMGLFHIKKISSFSFLYMHALTNARYPQFPSMWILNTCPTFVIFQFHTSYVFQSTTTVMKSWKWNLPSVVDKSSAWRLKTLDINSKLKANELEQAFNNEKSC